MKFGNGLIITDYPDKRLIYSEWTKHLYVFLQKDIEKNNYLEYTINMKYEKVRADGTLIARGIISII